MRFPGQIILGELGGNSDFARDLLKIGCYRGTAIAVPYGYAGDKNAAPAKAGAAVLMFGNFCPNTPDSAFDYDTAAGPHPPQRLRLGAPSPKGEGIGCDLIRRA